MNLTITGRHMEITDALREQLQHKLGRLDRYKLEFISASAVATIEKNRHRLEVNLRSRDGSAFTADVDSADMYANIDLAVDKLERQIRKHKERSRPRGGRDKEQRQALAHRTVFSLAPAEVDADGEAEAREKTIILEEELKLVPLSIEEAIAEMAANDRSFWLFLDEENYKLSVVYRRPDGQYGLIVPER